MKLPTQDETEALISLATNHHAMRLLHELPRKIVKLLCAALKREHEMRVARDKKIRGLLNEIERQKDLRRAAPNTEAEDLKTKLSRYEQALRDIAAFKEKDRTDAATTQWNRAGVYAATIARAALNVEASNDKG